MTALLLAALAVGLGNFAAAVGIGLSGVDTRTRLRVAVLFGIFESGMPLVGLVLGHHLADVLGSATRYLGGALLIGTGVWTLLQVRRQSAVSDDEDDATVASTGLGRLAVTALALSVDNLVVGFGLGVVRIRLSVAIAIFAIVSIALSLLGLELGRQLGARIESRSESLAGIVLIIVGVLVALGVL